MTSAENREPTLLGVLREPQPHVVVRSIASLALGCGLAAAGLLAANLTAELMFPRDWWWRHRYPLIGLSGASVVWLASLRLIWNPVRGRRQVVRPIFSTLAIWAAAILLCGIAHDEFIPVFLLLGFAFTLLCWASAFVRWSRGREVLGPDNLVDVRCPQCRYSLVGLTDCRCPECGFAFTIDGLIAAQGYGGIYARGEAPRVSKSDSPEGAVEGQLAPL